ncbi:MAG: hypothetical protein ACFE95_06280 [Candidatus Hodarchaeota archaeon]
MLNVVSQKEIQGFDELTRILTKDGFKLFDKINVATDHFITLNLDTEEIQLQKALRLHKNYYRGKIYTLQNKTINLVISQFSNILLRNRKGKVVLEKASEVFNSKTRRFFIPQKHKGGKFGKTKNYFILPKVKFGRGTKNIYKTNQNLKKVNMDDWLRFLGIFISDGYCNFNTLKRNYLIEIYQKKLNFYRDIEILLGKLPFNFKYSVVKSRFRCCNKQLSSYLSNLYSLSREKKIPKFIKDLHESHIKLFLEFLFKGDGCFKSNGELRYFATTSRSVARELPYLLCRVNKPFSMEIRPSPPFSRKKNKKSKKLLYFFHIKKGSNYGVGKYSIDLKQYCGNIYNIAIPNNTILVERCGKISWCGAYT